MHHGSETDQLSPGAPNRPTITAMPIPKRDDEREERITMEIVVDCYNESEAWSGWWCYLKRHALHSHGAGAARVYVVVVNGAVAAYYTLSAGSIETQAASPRLLRPTTHNTTFIRFIASLN